MPALKKHRAEMLGRAMLCRRTTVFPIECVIRGYVSGSAWKEYAATGTLAGEELEGGTRRKRELEASIFSPATKAETGHDENIAIGGCAEIVGDEVTYTLESMTARSASSARRSPASRASSSPTPSSNSAATRRRPHHPDRRSDDAGQFAVLGGRRLQARPTAGELDKQPLRDYLDVERRAGRWNGDAPPPPLPASVVDATSKRYLEAYRRVTGRELEDLGRRHLVRLAKAGDPVAQSITLSGFNPGTKGKPPAGHLILRDARLATLVGMTRNTCLTGILQLRARMIGRLARHEWRSRHR